MLSRRHCKLLKLNLNRKRRNAQLSMLVISRKISRPSKTWVDSWSRLSVQSYILRFSPFLRTLRKFWCRFTLKISCKPWSLTAYAMKLNSIFRSKKDARRIFSRDTLLVTISNRSVSFSRFGTSSTASPCSFSRWPVWRTTMKRKKWLRCLVS